MCIFKYPEKTERDDNPWSIRQTALYHKIRKDDCQSIIVLISPYPNSKARNAIIDMLLGIKSISRLREETFLPNTILQSVYMDGFRFYMSFYEREIQELVSPKHTINVEKYADNHDTIRMLSVDATDPDGVDPEDRSNLTFFKTRLLPIEPVLRALDLGMDGFDKVISHYDQVFTPYNAMGSWKQYLYNHRIKTATYRDQANTLLQKCANASQLLDSNLAHQQNSHILFLTNSTVDDSATVRVITAITLMFLSFTAVAVSPRVRGHVNDRIADPSRRSWRCRYFTWTRPRIPYCFHPPSGYTSLFLFL